MDPGFAPRRSSPALGNKQRSFGRLHAQSIQVAHLSGWRSGYFEGTLAGVPVMALASAGLKNRHAEVPRTP